MRKYQKYLPFIILTFLFLFVIPPSKPVPYEWIGLFILFIAIIYLFEFLEKSRSKKIKEWSNKKPKRISYILKYSLVYGLPISLIISILIYNKSEFIHFIIFIAIPILLIFGWIGYIEWRNNYEEYLEEKYKEKKTYNNKLKPTA